jgi:hypothetical protein
MREGFKAWLVWAKEPRNRTRVIAGAVAGFLIGVFSQFLPVWWQVGFYVVLGILAGILLKGFKK